MLYWAQNCATMWNVGKGLGMTHYRFLRTKLMSASPDELSASVSAVYNTHTLHSSTGKLVRRGSIWVRGVEEMALIDLAYGASVEIVPEPFQDFYLVTSTLRGHGSARHGKESVIYAPNQTTVFSVDRHYGFTFDPEFKQRSVRISRSHLHRFFAKWTGRPVEGGVDFQLCPFSPSLNARWKNAITLLDETDDTRPLPPLARERIVEFLLSMLLECHPHSKSADLASERQITPRHVRRAEEFMRANLVERLTMVEIAEAAGCSVRSLQTGFQAAHGVTPGEYLSQLRLDRARDMLLAARPGTSVTEVALSNGFSHLGRFSTAFAARFGERPVEMLNQGFARRP